MDKPVVVSVRLPGAELRKLQVLGQIYERSVGDLIRVAVANYVQELIRADDFQTKACSMRRRADETVSELLATSDAAAVGGSVVRPFPRHRAGSAPTSSDARGRATGDRRPAMALVDVNVARATAKIDIGAAASHQARSAPHALQWRPSFALVWKQDEQEWKMEGRSRGDIAEVILTCTHGAETTPTAVAWKDAKTGEIDRFPLRPTADGRHLVDMRLSKARRRAETVRDTSDPVKQLDALPVVHID